MWDEIYRKHYPELLQYAAAACRNQTEAEDMAQEVFLKALKSCDVFEELSPSQKRAWLFRTLKNLMCDRYRKSLLEQAYLEALEDEEAYPDTGIQMAENKLLLERLSPEDRALFCLRYFEDYNSTDLAEIFNQPTGTIRARLSRIRKQLKIMIT